MIFVGGHLLGLVWNTVNWVFVEVAKMLVELSTDKFGLTLVSAHIIHCGLLVSLACIFGSLVTSLEFLHLYSCLLIIWSLESAVRSFFPLPSVLVH